MWLEIFDVEHGACTLLTCDDGRRLMIDCGHNASTGWKPGYHLRSNDINAIDMLVITNYDEDHVSGIIDLFTYVYVGALLRNPTVPPSVLRRLKSDTGMGPGIDFLCERIDQTFTGPALDMTASRGLQCQLYWNAFPTFDDENNLSLALFLTCYGIKVLLPGDLEEKGWLALARNSAFMNDLKSTDVLVASHHGRDSGWSDILARNCAPYYVVISDKGYMYETQETLHLYRSIAQGGPFRDQDRRRVLTTRSDGKTTFRFDPAS